MGPGNLSSGPVSMAGVLTVSHLPSTEQTFFSLFPFLSFLFLSFPFFSFPFFNLKKEKVYHTTNSPGSGES